MSVLTSPVVNAIKTVVDTIKTLVDNLTILATADSAKIATILARCNVNVDTRLSATDSRLNNLSNMDGAISSIPTSCIRSINYYTVQIFASPQTLTLTTAVTVSKSIAIISQPGGRGATAEVKTTTTVELKSDSITGATFLVCVVDLV